MAQKIFKIKEVGFVIVVDFMFKINYKQLGLIFFRNLIRLLKLGGSNVQKETNMMINTVAHL